MVEAVPRLGGLEMRSLWFIAINTLMETRFGAGAAGLREAAARPGVARRHRARRRAEAWLRFAGGSLRSKEGRGLTMVDSLASRGSRRLDQEGSMGGVRACAQLGGKLGVLRLEQGDFQLRGKRGKEKISGNGARQAT